MRLALTFPCPCAPHRLFADDVAADVDKRFNKERAMLSVVMTISWQIQLFIFGVVEAGLGDDRTWTCLQIHHRVDSSSASRSGLRRSCRCARGDHIGTGSRVAGEPGLLHGNLGPRHPGLGVDRQLGERAASSQVAITMVARLRAPASAESPARVRTARLWRTARRYMRSASTRPLVGSHAPRSRICDRSVGHQSAK
jgi:hypothetical protein